MSASVIDGKAVRDAVDKHDANRERFHEALLKLYPDKLRCSVCGYPLKKVRMTRTTTLTITIRSKMTMPIRVETNRGDRGYTKEFQKQLHEGIASSIVSAVEHARDDNQFDDTALSELHVDAADFGIKGEIEISDFADVRLIYKHGKETWIGDVLMTKAERQTS